MFPGSKVQIEQPVLFWLSARGGSGGPWGSAEPGWPCATCGGAGDTGTGAGQEPGYAITVPGVFIALGPVRWKMFPRPPSKNLLRVGGGVETSTPSQLRSSLLVFLRSVPKMWDPSGPGPGVLGPPRLPRSSWLCRVLGPPRAAHGPTAPFCRTRGAALSPPYPPVTIGRSVPARWPCCPPVGVTGGGPARLCHAGG